MTETRSVVSLPFSFLPFSSFIYELFDMPHSICSTTYNKNNKKACAVHKIFQQIRVRWQFDIISIK